MSRWTNRRAALSGNQRKRLRTARQDSPEGRPRNKTAPAGPGLFWRAAGWVEVNRFKGLGEMMPAQLKETTMDPAKRTLLKVVLLADDRDTTADSVEQLMGTKAEARFAFISDKAEFASEELLEV